MAQVPPPRPHSDYQVLPSPGAVSPSPARPHSAYQNLTPASPLRDKSTGVLRDLRPASSWTSFRGSTQEEEYGEESFELDSEDSDGEVKKTRRTLGQGHRAQQESLEMSEMSEMIEEPDAESAGLLRREGEDDGDKDGPERLKEVELTDLEQMVARTTSSTDDITLPSLTLRVILLGTIFVIIGATASTIFMFRSNAPVIGSFFFLLASLPLGHALAYYLPQRHFMGINLNPGKFSVKEHLLIGVIASSGGGVAYAADIISIMRLYYHQDLGHIASLTLLITTQSLGFGLAGMLENVLIKPPSMVWPSTLVTVQLFTTLHDRKDPLTRVKVKIFTGVFGLCFVYQFLPAVFMPALSSIATLCLVSNKSWLLRTLGSGYNGMGMGCLSFDWNAVGAAGPLYTPWFALINYFAGLVGMVWIILGVVLFTNFWDAQSFPSAVSAGLFNSNFTKFDVHQILKPDLSLDKEAWKLYQPLLLTPYFALSYGLSFAALSSVLVHVWVWHRQEIMESLSRRTAHEDIHNVLMRSYKRVPSSWYIGILVVNFGAAVILIKTNPLQMPIWALVLSVAIAVVFLVPIGVIAAVSNFQIGLNVITEWVAGMLMPGKPIGNVMFKCMGYLSLAQALSLLGDMKLGHYMKIPPRHMFIAQVYGAVIGCVVNYTTLVQVIEAKRPYLDGTLVDPTGQWTGRGPAIFYSASVVWGLVAPARFFSGKYVLLYGGFVLGAIVPIACYYGHKRYPKMKLDQVFFPIVCSGATVVPQFPANIIMSSFAVAYISNQYIAKKYPDWHKNYIYIVSSALDAATSINALTVFIFFTLLAPGLKIPSWWGNSSIDTEHCIEGS